MADPPSPRAVAAVPVRPDREAAAPAGPRSAAGVQVARPALGARRVRVVRPSRTAARAVEEPQVAEARLMAEARLEPAETAVDETLLAEPVAVQKPAERPPWETRDRPRAAGRQVGRCPACRRSW